MSRARLCCFDFVFTLATCSPLGRLLFHSALDGRHMTLFFARLALATDSDFHFLTHVYITPSTNTFRTPNSRYIYRASSTIWSPPFCSA
jgi:hypothetical protein